MSQIQVQHLSFAYDGSYDMIFEDVSFCLDTDWRLGFTGRNGRGKTTFLNLLQGKQEYQGVISASVEFAYFPYTLPEPGQMALEALMALCPAAKEWKLLRECALLQLDAEALYRPFATLSGGEQSKALLAALFLGENRFLLIDEPTNHLDSCARQALGRYLQSKNGFLLVSHDRALLDSCTDHTLSINKANIEVVSGNFSSWWEQKQGQDAFEQAQHARLTKEVGRLREAAARSAAFADKTEREKRTPLKSGLSADVGYIGHKSAKMMKRAKSAQRRQESAIEEKTVLLHNVERADDLKLQPLRFHSDLLIELRQAAVMYDGKEICAPVTLQIRQGERIALQGKNGSGKSSLLKLIVGQPINYNGEILRPRQLIISYISQDTSFLKGSLRDYIEESGVDESLCKAILRKLDFTRMQFEKNLEDYSAGQKKKVLLARSLCERAHLYVWDEPLNYIDVYSRMQIEQLLREYQPTMVFVEHDAAFLEQVATKIVEIA